MTQGKPQPLNKQVLRYFGGKGGKLARWIISHMPKHEAYIEPFCGGASVFFMKEPSEVEVINDLNGEVINFFRVCREQPDELARLLAFTTWGREEFAIAWGDDTGISDVERARRLAVKAWQGFGHKVTKKTGWNKAFITGGLDTKAWQSVPDVVIQAAHRLRNANIESMDAVELLRIYNEPLQTQLFTRVFYVDPPYVHETLLSSHGYGEYDVDHAALLDALRANNYYVLLSGYDSELYRDTLADWHMVTIEKRDHVQNLATECLWLNPAAWAALQEERGMATQRRLFDVGDSHG